MLRWKCEVEILVSVRRKKKNGNVRMGDEIGGGMRGADRLSGEFLRGGCYRPTTAPMIRSRQGPRGPRTSSGRHKVAAITRHSISFNFSLFSLYPTVCTLHVDHGQKMWYHAIDKRHQMNRKQARCVCCTSALHECAAHQPSPQLSSSSSASLGLRSIFLATTGLDAAGFPSAFFAAGPDLANPFGNGFEETDFF